MNISRARDFDRLALHMAGMSIGEHREGRSRGAPIYEEEKKKMYC